MPGINVAALTEGDLRRLLKVAHARADGLLADRLEWEIAARASSVVRPAGPFATLADDPDEAAEHLAPYEAQSFAPELAGRHPVSGRRSGALLLSLGAVAGSLLSATVFWGIERLPTLDSAEPHPTRAMSLRSAPLVRPPAPAPEQAVAQIAPEQAPEQAVARIAPEQAPEQAVAQIAPEAFPPLPKPIAVVAPAAPPPPVEVAKEAAPAKPVVVMATSEKPVEPRKPAIAKTQVAAKKASPKKELALQKAPAAKEQAELKTGPSSRPPTLAEWLAKSEPTARQQ